jgi:hypothetical protein
MIPNWFEAYGPAYFERHLRPLAGKPGLRFLQIGAFAGDASVWLLDHILTGAGSTLTDVDTWEGSPDIHDIDFAEVERLYDSRCWSRTFKRKMTSAEYFACRHREDTRPFDFVYIDGDHTLAAVRADLAALPLALAPSAIVAFDDFARRDFGVAAAVAPLATRADPRWECLGLGHQAWFRWLG